MLTSYEGHLTENFALVIKMLTVAKASLVYLEYCMLASFGAVVSKSAGIARCLGHAQNKTLQKE